MAQELNPLKAFGPLSHDAARRAFVVTPSDSVDLTPSTRGLMVTVAGNVKVTMLDDTSPVVLPGLLAGVLYPFAVKRIWSGSTTATGIVAFV